MIRGAVLLLTATLALAFSGAGALAREKIRADRTPMTYRDSGLYCGYRRWRTDASNAKIPNMLPITRAASPESPWTFYIMQISAKEKPLRGLTGRTLQEMAKNGKKPILRVGLGRRPRNPKTGRPQLLKNPSVDMLEQRLVNLFEKVDPDWVYAITLDEENVYWNGWDKALAELYERCKKRWPDLPVYQWWSPMQVPDVTREKGWVALPADGWIIDLYGRPREEFEKKVLKCLETGKPVVHIAWASPKWVRFSGADSWEDGGRRILDDQMDVCRAYNIPVAYFCTQKYVMEGKKRVEPIRWGWQAKDPDVRQWYRELETIAMNQRFTPESEMGFRAPTPRLFEWAHATVPPVEVSVSLDDEGRKRFVWRSKLPDISIKPGEHALATPYDSSLVQPALILDDAAVSALDDGLAVRGVDKRTNRASLVFRLDPKRPLEDLSVTARIGALKVLGGRASIAVSTDGADWSEPIYNDPSGRHDELTVMSPAERAKDAPVWVLVTLEGRAGKRTKRAASLKWIEVAATFEPAL